MLKKQIGRALVGPEVLVALSTAIVAPARAEGAAQENTGASGPEGEAHLVLPRPNQGEVLSVALLSAGALGFDPDRTNRGLTMGTTALVQLGGSVTDWLDLGVGIAYGQTFGPEQDRIAYGRLTVHSQWYLNPRWFACLDLGAGSVAGRDPLDPSHDRGGYSEVYAVGVGYNLFLSSATHSGGWILSPVLGADVTPSDDFTAVVGWAGLEVSYWTGLAKDKLMLPHERAYE